MKKGILVYDKADAEYNEWFISEIIAKGSEAGLDISLVLTEEIAENSEEATEKKIVENLAENCDFAIMRNRNYEMSIQFEEKGVRCFNSSSVCEIGNDKWKMYQEFQKAGIPVMYTQQKKLPYPFVMKPKDGHGGNNVYLIRNQQEYDSVIDDINSDYAHMSYIYQFVASNVGRDIRVYVVGDMILTAMERVAGGNEFRANFSLGGSASEHALTDDELKLAAKVANHIKPDFVGIDIIYNGGKPIVNEIEDAVGTRMLYKYTDIDPVKEYISWIVRELNK